MATLYKRYIPSNKPAADEKPTSLPQKFAPATPSIPPRINEPSDKKRKRTQEEVVARKAKKLKKKGLDPEQALGQATAEIAAISLKEPALDDDEGRPQPQGEFAHIKSAKKRHKLEKEARKARKAAEKVSKLEAVEGHVDEDDSAEEPATAPPKQQRHRPKEAPTEEPSPDEDTSISVDEDTERLKKFSGVLGKFHKSTKLSQNSKSNGEDEVVPETRPIDESKVIRDLILPLPKKAATPEFVPDDSSLPAWLAKSTIISSDSKQTFSGLGLDTETVHLMSKLGFTDALPVQQAVLPVLLPPGVPGSKYLAGSESVVPDLAVGAATGSGKTIAYLLPMLKGLTRTSNPGRLRALIIVPTKELVQQVAAVADSLFKGSGIKVGMSSGTGRFGDEQRKLIRQTQRYHPEEYAKLISRADLHTRGYKDEDSEECRLWVEELADRDEKTEQRIHDAVFNCMTNWIPVYESVVDVLVATPGRLSEHLETTLGFNLVHLEWLVIDEVDKLLDREFSFFMRDLTAEVARPRTYDEQDDRERHMRRRGLWHERWERRTRKAVFSATMTRDISKLESLKLRYPQMVVVRGSDADGNDDLPSGVEVADGRPVEQDPYSTTAQGQAKGTGTDHAQEDGEFELPRTLLEYFVPVGDGSEKPLIALELLESKILPSDAQLNNTSSPAEESDDTSSVTSDDSTSSSDVSDHSSTSDASSVHSFDPATDERPKPRGPAPSHVHPDRLAALGPAPAVTALIFTSSNESASRLSHVLKQLKPAWASWITTLTKANAGKAARPRSKPGEPAIVISTDRVARGLDNFHGRHVTHVLQYDVPRSVTGYVHRVGRTARAGRKGQAWTLVAHAEGRWFDHEIVKARGISRTGVVERVKVFVSDSGMRERLGEVVSGMRDEVLRGKG